MVAQLIDSIPSARYERTVLRLKSCYPELWDILDQVTDPEIPVVSIWELGILRDVDLKDDTVFVDITPTYSGCPAVDTMKDDIVIQLNKNGFSNVHVNVVLSPAWSTDDITSQGHAKMREYGIAPPNDSPLGCAKHLTPSAGVRCPLCSSDKTQLISEFGSTACKALFKCDDCLEPFDFFKCI
jgi:ring-1,2-phenylacetyl-CoA epoxidase subunit PaaD